MPETGAQKRSSAKTPEAPVLGASKTIKLQG